ncbi:hypothetical protein N9B82_04135 [Saprospiraceae bacterium]|nr:hypothetical protein [Saprospiraceae bacterium]
MTNYSKLKIVNSHLNYDNVSLIEPTTHYYLQIALHVDSPKTPFFFFDSNLKKKIIKKCKQFCSELSRQKLVIEANLFKAILIPPGRSRFLAENRDKVQLAKFDVVILIEVDSKEDLEWIEKDDSFLEIIKYLEENSKDLLQVKTRNARRIGDVDHTRQGVFLFNYFFADDLVQNLEVWNYTAGWFENETALDNSTLLVPLEKDAIDYTVINHCRWDNLTDILPSLIFKRTFKSYVLENFYENNVGAMPLLYKLVK